MFAGFSVAEQACVRSQIQESDLEAGLDLTVLTEGETDQFQIALFDCMDPDAARELFLATLIAGIGQESPEGFTPGAEELACLRDWSEQIDIAQLVADSAGDGADQFTAEIGGILNCLPEAFLQLMLEGIGVSRDELSPEQLECLQELLEGLDWNDLFSAAEGEDEGAALLIGFQFLACLPELLTGEFGDDVEPVETLHDDHGDDLDVATSLAPGTAAAGAIDYLGDVDFFSFAAREGVFYQIEVRADVELANPTLDLDPTATLYGPDGEWLEYNDDYGGDLAARILWRAQTSAPHYIEVATYSGRGTYQLTLVEVDINDDHGDDFGAATAIALGRPVEGMIDYPGDLDVFSITAAADGVHRYTLEYTTLGDAGLTVLASDGSELLTDADHYFGKLEFGSRIFLPVRGGETYFIAVDGFSGTGGYVLAAQVSGVRDDHGNRPGEASRIAPGAAIAGALDYPGDVDAFLFAAEAGRIYEIEAEAGTLASLNLSVSAPDGSHRADGRPTGLLTTGTTVKTLATGDHFVRLESYAGIGTYELTVRRSDVVDDHGDEPDAATPLEVGAATTGAIDYAGDVDYFKFEAAAAVLYAAEVSTTAHYGPVIEVFDEAGSPFVSDVAELGSGEAIWWAQAGSSYHVAVWYQDDSTGPFTLTVRESGIADDHGNDATAATPIAVGRPAAGELQYGADVDVFAFFANAGATYRIDVSLGTLGDSTLDLVDSADHILASNDDYGGSLASRIEDWEAPESGTYFVRVEGFGGVGTYTVQVDGG